MTASARGDGGIPAGALLAGLAEAMWGRDPDQIARAREAVVGRLGGDALTEAVGVSANFHMMTRIADGTGTPLDRGSVAPSEEIRDAIGVNGYVSRRQMPASAD